MPAAALILAGRAAAPPVTCQAMQSRPPWPSPPFTQHRLANRKAVGAPFTSDDYICVGQVTVRDRVVPAAMRSSGFLVEANEPRLIAFNEHRSEVTVVQVYPDAASMKFHMGIVGDHARQAYAQLPGVCRELRRVM